VPSVLTPGRKESKKLFCWHRKIKNLNLLFKTLEFFINNYFYIYFLFFFNNLE